MDINVQGIRKPGCFMVHMQKWMWKSPRTMEGSGVEMKTVSRCQVFSDQEVYTEGQEVAKNKMVRSDGRWHGLQ